jgi:hypothetical protein
MTHTARVMLDGVGAGATLTADRAYDAISHAMRWPNRGSGRPTAAQEARSRVPIQGPRLSASDCRGEVL